jgi:hypothetical protein
MSFGRNVLQSNPVGPAKMWRVPDNAASSAYGQWSRCGHVFLILVAATRTRGFRLPYTFSHSRTPLVRTASLLLALVLSAPFLAGCASMVADNTPVWAGGEAEGTPARPQAAPDFQPVNDRPPPRDTKLVSDQDLAQMERDLTKARDAQLEQARALQKERDATKPAGK